MTATLNQLNEIGSELSLNAGAVTIALLDANDNVISAFEPLGYVDTAELSSSVDSIEKKNSASGANITVGSANINTTVELALTVSDFKPENIERFFFGKKSDVAALVSETVTKTAYVGKTIDLDGILPEDTTNVIVTDTGSVNTYTEGTDYVVERTGGITILEGGAIIEEEQLQITYDTVAISRVEGFTESNIFVKIIIRGVNQDTGKFFKGTMHKVQLSPVDAFSFISPEEYNTATINGTLIASKAVSGAGLSKLIKYETE